MPTLEESNYLFCSTPSELLYPATFKYPELHSGLFIFKPFRLGVVIAKGTAKKTVTRSAEFEKSKAKLKEEVAKTSKENDEDLILFRTNKEQEDLSDEALLASIHVSKQLFEEGNTNIKDYTNAMVKEIGNSILPHIREVYNFARFRSKEFDLDTYQQVDEFQETINNRLREIAEQKALKEKKNQENKTENQNKDLPLQGNLFDNLKTEENGKSEISERDNSGTKSEQGTLSETKQVGRGAPTKDTSRDSESERRRPNQRSTESRTRPEYDVNKNYTNEEIHEVVSSVTEVKNDKVEL